ncbi:MAG: hypothetical protein KAR20_10310, partial [Candidatus Heimdallarchaeota archaeon]|nr:hypothetical protein [Candidatus Heimdallarchaeota archaeon]
MKKYYVISRFYLRVIIFCLLLFVVFAVSGCATSGFLGFGDPLATSSYVDSTAAESDKRIAEMEEEIMQISNDISVMKS